MEAVRGRNFNKKCYWPQVPGQPLPEAVERTFRIGRLELRVPNGGRGGRCEDDDEDDESCLMPPHVDSDADVTMSKKSWEEIFINISILSLSPSLSLSHYVSLSLSSMELFR